MAVSKNARERLAVMPDRLCVGHCIFHAQAKETHEGKSVRNLKLHLAVGKVMEALQNKDPEHGHKAERRSGRVCKSNDPG
ncbi:MAG: hypothetical protein M0P13_10735 [Fibrobacteraceae bacterium]|nr:hypothetical protein [Fibrobacteraceae bacterium]